MEEIIDIHGFKRQIPSREDVIDEYKNALLKYDVIDKSVVRRVAEQLKEHK